MSQFLWQLSTGISRGQESVLPLMGDALEAFSSPFRPVNKQLRKPEGSIRLYRLLGPLPGGGCKGLR